MCPITPVTHLNLVGITIIHWTYDSSHDYMLTMCHIISHVSKCKEDVKKMSKSQDTWTMEEVHKKKWQTDIHTYWCHIWWWPKALKMCILWTLKSNLTWKFQICQFFMWGGASDTLKFEVQLDLNVLNVPTFHFWRGRVKVALWKSEVQHDLKVPNLPTFHFWGRGLSKVILWNLKFNLTWMFQICQLFISGEESLKWHFEI